jgi:hypothetical protein
MNENNNQNASSGDSGEPAGKVLPFRKPTAIQPTLRRRAGGTHIQHKTPMSSRKEKAAPAWKTQVARGLQVALLLTALLLALKNCGKI